MSEKIVPREPTPGMIGSARELWYSINDIPTLWRVMYDAAPTSDTVHPATDAGPEAGADAMREFFAATDDMREWTSNHQWAPYAYNRFDDARKAVHDLSPAPAAPAPDTAPSVAPLPDVGKMDARYFGPEDYAARNPLGGIAKCFDIMADRLRAGEDYDSVISDYALRRDEPCVAAADPTREEVAALIADVSIGPHKWRERATVMLRKLSEVAPAAATGEDAVVDALVGAISDPTLKQLASEAVAAKRESDAELCRRLNEVAKWLIRQPGADGFVLTVEGATYRIEALSRERRDLLAGNTALRKESANALGRLRELEPDAAAMDEMRTDARRLDYVERENDPVWRIPRDERACPACQAPVATVWGWTTERINPNAYPTPRTAIDEAIAALAKGRP